MSRVKELEGEGRHFYAKSFKETHASLFKFAEIGLTFKEITPQFLSSNISCEKLVKMEELHEAALKILYYFQNIPKSEKVEYISPIIHKYNLSDNQINSRYIRQLKKLNKQLKFIAKNVGINKNITSYVARHSFATHLKFNRV